MNRTNSLYLDLETFIKVTDELIGEDDVLEPASEWLAKAKPYGGSLEEYERIYDVTNDYNNLRAEQRTRRDAIVRRIKESK